MSRLMLIGTEITFNIAYLMTIWTLVILMSLNFRKLNRQEKIMGRIFIWSFFLLALGDTGHVGFRVLAFVQGGLENNSTLVGLGALATAVTVGFFYILITEFWRQRFKRKRGVIWWVLVLAGIIRLILMTAPGNMWGSLVPPLSWSLARNIPLMIQGIGTAIVLLKDGQLYNDKLAKRISLLIFLSYLFYLPVILFIQTLPLLGMLMIPKTLCYIGIALHVYKSMFKSANKLSTQKIKD